MEGLGKILIIAGVMIMIITMWAQWLGELKDRQERVHSCQTFYVPQKVRVNCP